MHSLLTLWIWKRAQSVTKSGVRHMGWSLAAEILSHPARGASLLLLLGGEVQLKAWRCSGFHAILLQAGFKLSVTLVYLHCSTICIIMFNNTTEPYPTYLVSKIQITVDYYLTQDLHKSTVIIGLIKVSLWVFRLLRLSIYWVTDLHVFHQTFEVRVNILFLENVFSQNAFFRRCKGICI